MSAILIAAGYFIFLVALMVSGNYFCRLTLKIASAAKTEDDDFSPKAGRTIGVLERLLIAIGLFAHSWEIILAVVALKTVARYKKLDQKTDAEYFLIGSLASILWAIMIGAAMLIYDREWGANLSAALAQAVGG